MRVCTICIAELPDEKYSTKDAEICTVCQEKVAKITNVAYAIPERKSRLHAYLLLIEAIRKQAERDDAVAEFEVTWIYTHPWPVIWNLMGSLEIVDTHTTGVLR